MSDFVDDVNLMKWVHCFKKLPPESLKVRLLCLHWAGGNGMVYRPWSLKLNPLGIEVYTMNCPGRLNRAKEPLVTDLEVIKGTCCTALFALSCVSTEHSVLLRC